MLVAATGVADGALRAAAATADAGAPVRLGVIRVDPSDGAGGEHGHKGDPHASDTRSFVGAAVELRAGQGGLPAFTATDACGMWQHLAAHCGAEAALVRPDGHVAWLGRQGDGGESRLRSALVELGVAA